MKRLFVIFPVIFLLVSYAKADNILNQLKKPLIKKQNGKLTISHIDKVSFTEKVMILMDTYQTATIESYCEMPEGLLDTGYFTAICVSLTSGIEQDLFAPVFNKIKTVDWLLNPKNIKPDFKIEAVFSEKGLHIFTRDKRGSRDFFVSYEEIIHTKISP